MANLKDLIPFLKFFTNLEIQHQLWYLVWAVISVAVFLVITNYVNSLKYHVDFEVYSSINRKKILEEDYTIILNNSKTPLEYNVKAGKFEDKLDPGKYIFKVMPKRGYRISYPTEIEVNKNISSPVRIYLDVLKRHINKGDGETKEIKPSNTRAVQTGPNELTLFTIIKALHNSENVPLENLTFGNFSVFESYNRNTKKAEIFELKTIQSSSLNIVLILDLSGSMNLHMLHARKAVELLINKFKNLSDRKRINGRIAVLPVGGFSIDERNFIKNNSSSKKSFWFDFDKGSLDKLIKEIKKTDIKSNSRTPLYDAINLSITQLMQLDQISQKVIVCLTDGDENESKFGEDKTIDIITGKENIERRVKEEQIPFIAVGFENPDNEKKLGYLKDIAKASGVGGKDVDGFFDYNDPNQLKDIYIKIANSLTKTYKLSWKTTAKVNIQVTFIIKIQYEGRNGVFETTITKRQKIQDMPVQEVSGNRKKMPKI